MEKKNMAPKLIHIWGPMYKEVGTSIGYFAPVLHSFVIKS